MRTIRGWLAIAATGVCLAMASRSFAQDPASLSPEGVQRLKTLANRGPGAESPDASLFADPIETDRDSFTPSPATAGRRRFILEAAYSIIDNRNAHVEQSFPELVLRYGITKRIELRLGWNAAIGGGGDTVSGGGSSSFSPIPGVAEEYRILYGTKLAVTEQRRFIPQSALLLQGFTPTGGDFNDTNFAATYVAGWELPNRWKLDGAIRYARLTEVNDHFSTWDPSFVVKIPIRERLSVHAEYFGIFENGKALEKGANYISPGVHFLITPNLEFGARLGWGLNASAERFFANLGVGWRY